MSVFFIYITWNVLISMKYDKQQLSLPSLPSARETPGATVSRQKLPWPEVTSSTAASLHSFIAHVIKWREQSLLSSVMMARGGMPHTYHAEVWKIFKLFYR